VPLPSLCRQLAIMANKAALRRFCFTAFCPILRGLSAAPSPCLPIARVASGYSLRFNTIQRGPLSLTRLYS
jgi:hypothetical protein